MKYIAALLFSLFQAFIVSFSQTIAFQDNFESGYLDKWYGGGFNIISEEDNNLVLEMKVHNWAFPILRYSFYNYDIELDIKVLSSEVEVWFRHNDTGEEEQKGYYLKITNNEINLYKAFGTHSTILISDDVVLDSNIWYNLKVELRDQNIKIYLNQTKLLEFDDNNNPFLIGNSPLTFHVLPESHARFDNIVIKALIPEQSAKWVRTGGPWGGIGYDVRIDPKNPDIVYVTDQWAGNHKSINGGATWYPNNKGIETVFGSTGESVPIFCLTIDPNNTNNVWCATFGKRGVYRSIDKGESWDKKVNGIPEFPCGITFRGIAIRPGSSNVVFCGVEINSCDTSLSKGKIFKTVDFGENWREVLNSDALIRHILINPDHPDTMYASTGIFDRDCVNEEGVWKSADGGETWYHANNGLTDLTVGGLFMDPNNPKILWVSTGREPQFGGDGTGEIFITTDGGNSWKEVFPLNHEPVWPINSITTSLTNSNIIYAANEGHFFVCKNNGNTWNVWPVNIPGIYTGIPVGIAAHPTYGNFVLTNSYSGGVFGSVDGGQTWAPYNNGYTGAEMLDIIVDPIESRTALAVGRSGIAKTDDGGISWAGAGHHPEWFPGAGSGPIGEMYLLAINHQNRNSLLTGAFWGTHLYKTTDKFNWSIIYDFRNQGIQEGHGIGAIQYAHIDSNIIYLGIRYNTLPLVMDRPHHYDPNIISYGIFKSTNSGLSWTEINNGLENTTKNIQTIALNRDNPDTVYIGVYGFGVYKTTDGGLSWHSSSSGITSYLIASLAVDPNNNNIIYAGAENGGLFKSIDGGNSWERTVFGMDPEASIRSIVIDPTNSQNVYAADWHTGVYYTNDGGEIWAPFNDGLTTRSVQKLAISRDGETLYAATQGLGVFHLSYENLAPGTQYVYPLNDSTIYLSSDDSTEFILGVIDLNGDSLSYQWYLDNNIISGAINTKYSFYAKDVSFGNHTLTCEISDGEFTETISWNMEVIDPESITNVLIEIPNKFNLSQNYPNPFNTKTNIKFSLPTSQHVKIEVYNIVGGKIETLLNKQMTVGSHKIEFNAEDLVSGVYFYKIEAGDFQEIKKAILLK